MGGEHGPPRIPRGRAWCCLLLAIAVFGLVPSSAKADSVELQFLGISPAGGGDTNWIYAARLTPTNYVETGNTVTIFDFGGFVSGSFTPDPPVGGPGYTVTSATDAPVQPAFPGETPPAGDLGLADIVFTYSGVSPYLAVGSTAPGDTFLGLFTLRSTFNTGALDVVVTTDVFTGPDLLIGGGDDVANQVTRITTVARSGGFTIVPLPLPVFGGAALMGLVALRRWSGSAQAA